MTTVVVFGGAGFLGRRLVLRLTTEGMTVRVAVRHPDHARIELQSIGFDRVTVVPADVCDQASVATAIAGADAVVNTVSAYVEKGGVTSSCLSPASARMLIQGLLTSVLEDAANKWSIRRFRRLRSSARAPCLARATHCSAHSPSLPDCCRYCR